MIFQRVHDSLYLRDESIYTFINNFSLLETSGYIAKFNYRLTNHLINVTYNSRNISEFKMLFLLASKDFQRFQLFLNEVN